MKYTAIEKHKIKPTSALCLYQPGAEQTKKYQFSCVYIPFFLLSFHFSYYCHHTLENKNMTFAIKPKEQKPWCSGNIYKVIKNKAMGVIKLHLTILKVIYNIENTVTSDHRGQTNCLHSKSIGILTVGVIYVRLVLSVLPGVLCINCKASVTFGIMMGLWRHKIELFSNKFLFYDYKPTGLPTLLQAEVRGFHGKIWNALLDHGLAHSSISVPQSKITF